MSSLKYLHLDKGIFSQVRRLAWCNDPESYVGGSVATGTATVAGQVKGEHPDKERYTGPPVGVSVNGPSHGKRNTHAKKNLDKGSEKRTVYLIKDFNP